MSNSSEFSSCSWVLFNLTCLFVVYFAELTKIARKIIEYYDVVELIWLPPQIAINF